MVKKGKTMVIPVFIPWAGCESRCVYCNETVTTGIHGAKSPEYYDETVAVYLKSMGRYERIQLGFYGGTFSNADKTLQRNFLEWGYNWIKTGSIDSIRISTRPDALNDDILYEYESFGVRSVELGVQSLSDAVLDKINRRHDSATAVSAFETVKSHEMELGVHMMTGLPGSDYRTDEQSIKKLVGYAPDTVRIHPTIVLKNTALERMYLNGSYVPETLGQSVENCARLKRILNRENIKVNRIGLFIPSENKDGIVAGPYHPAFGDLVGIMSLVMEISEHLEKGYDVGLQKKDYDSLFSHNGFFLPYLEGYLRKDAIKIL